LSDDLIKSSEPRFAGSLQRRRVQQAWPADREFKILSIDGGGIRGIFPAIILAELEERFLGGEPIADQFDLITGTSTGGIIALGLAAGLRPRDMANLYVDKGREIFPPLASNWRGRLSGLFNWFRDLAYYRYDRESLHSLLKYLFKDKLLGDTKTRLCIPSADGNHGNVYIFKTHHHPDYQKDQHELMLKVACATSAAPTFFQPLDDGGYRFLDGGLWANNPIMIGVVDVLSCFDVDRHSVSVLSLGCGDENYMVGNAKVKYGGKLLWADVIDAAMSFQSQNALGQARLLLGAERVLRVTPPIISPPIRLDDWIRASTELPSLASNAVDESGEEIARRFLSYN
jgi:uncharacterized protein